MASDVVLHAEGVGKKFCRSLRRSMWYGLRDVSRDVLGLPPGVDRLRDSEFWAVDDVSFELRQGECLGLVGSNGAGKSTLLKMLNGIIRPDRGRIGIRGRVGALIEVGAGFHPQLSGRENIYVNGTILGMSRREIDAKFDRIVEFADIGDFLDAPVKTYSSGMYVRLGMAVAVHTEPQILLVDEVFAVGDMNFQAKCFNKIGEMRHQGTTFILVSHNIHHIASFCDRVLAMDRGRVLAYGPTREVIEAYVKLMESRRRKDRHVHDDSLKGSDRVRFRGVRLQDNNGRTISRVRSSDPVRVEIDYESQVDIDGVELDMVVYDSDNSVFLQVSNRLLDQAIPLEKGRGRLAVRFPCLPSNDGRLKITLALWNADRTELFDWRRDLILDVEGCPSSIGYNWIPCEYELVHSMSEAAYWAADPLARPAAKL